MGARALTWLPPPPHPHPQWDPNNSAHSPDRGASPMLLLPSTWAPLLTWVPQHRQPPQGLRSLPSTPGRQGSALAPWTIDMGRPWGTPVLRSQWPEQGRSLDPLAAPGWAWREEAEQKQRKEVAAAPPAAPPRPGRGVGGEGPAALAAPSALASREGRAVSVPQGGPATLPSTGRVQSGHVPGWTGHAQVFQVASRGTGLPGRSQRLGQRPHSPATGAGQRPPLCARQAPLGAGARGGQQACGAGTRQGAVFAAGTPQEACKAHALPAGRECRRPRASSIKGQAPPRCAAC